VEAAVTAWVTTDSESCTGCQCNEMCHCHGGSGVRLETAQSRLLCWKSTERESFRNVPRLSELFAALFRAGAPC
jgi:hypothetical protein